MKKVISLILIIMMVSSLGLVGCNSNNSKVTTPDDNVSNVDQGNSQPVATPDNEQEVATNNPSIEKDPEGNTLRVGMEEAKGTFSPLYYTSTYDGNVVSLVYEGLLLKDRDGKYQPSVAKSYEITNDVTYTFKLDENKKFSDGTPVTAYDVEFTYLVAADPTYDGRMLDYVQDLIGFDEYSKEGSSLEKLAGINVIDEYTIQFTFEEPKRTNISRFGLGIVPRHYYDYSKGNLEDLKGKLEQPLGSGPYKLDTFVPKQFVQLVKNEHYISEGYKIEKVLMKFVEQATEMEEILMGNVDVLAGQIEPRNLDQARESGFIDMVQYPRSGFGYLKFNCASGITGDAAVRQALAYAYDGDLFTETYFEGLAVTQDVPMSQVSWAYTEKLKNEMTHYGFDPNKANEILDEAGWKLGADGIRVKDGQPLILRIPAMPDHSILDVLVPMLIEQWGAVGAKVEVSYMDFNSLSDLVNGDNIDQWELFFLACTLPSDPDVLYGSWHSSNAIAGRDNTARYVNPELDKLLEKGRTIFDIEEAIPVYEEIGMTLNRDIPIIVVYANTYTDMFNQRIKGMETNSLFDWTQCLENMTIEQ